MFILSNYCICNGFLMFSSWSLRAKGPVFPVTSSPLRWRNELQKCCPPLDLEKVKYLEDSAPGFPDPITPYAFQVSVSVGRGRWVPRHKRTSGDFPTAASCTSMQRPRPYACQVLLTASSPLQPSTMVLIVFILLAFPLLIIRVIKFHGKNRAQCRIEKIILSLHLQVTVP